MVRHVCYRKRMESQCHGSENRNESSRTGMKNAKVTYNIAELVAQCDPDAPVPEDVIAWERMTPVGKEIVQVLDEENAIE
jgi:hypothetical protein